MISRWLFFALRVLIAVSAAKMMFREGMHPLLMVPCILIYAMGLFFLFGHSWVQHFGEKWTKLYMPDDSNFRILPQYSRAESRFKQGKYEEAIEEFNQVLEEYPDDVYAHVKVAEIYTSIYKDYPKAETELLKALTKPISNDGWAFAAHRLADLYHDQLNQPQKSLEVMQLVQLRLPNTKYAAFAEKRAQLLKEFCDGYVPPPVRSKIQMPVNEADQQPEEAKVPLAEPTSNLVQVDMPDIPPPRKLSLKRRSEETTAEG